MFIFIVGCPRSGTTLAQELLHRHSSISIAPETHFIRRFIKKTQDDLPGVESGGAWKSYVDGMFELPEVREMEISRPVDPAEMERLYSLAPESLFRWLLESYRKQKGTPIVGEKTPNHLLYMNEIHNIFPDSRFLTIVRDPRAVVASWKKVPWSNGSVSADARVWQRYQHCLEHTNTEIRDRTFLIKFEDLVSTPREQLQKICDWLKLDFEESMVKDSGISSAVNTQREPWKHRVGGSFEPGRISDWKAKLSGREIACVEAACRNSMEQLGYPVQSGSIRLASGLMFNGLNRIQKFCQRFFRKTRAAE